VAGHPAQGRQQHQQQEGQHHAGRDQAHAVGPEAPPGGAPDALAGLPGLVGHGRRHGQDRRHFSTTRGSASL
jgi:hypothetical protein